MPFQDLIAHGGEGRLVTTPPRPPALHILSSRRQKLSPSGFQLNNFMVFMRKGSLTFNRDADSLIVFASKVLLKAALVTFK